MYIGSARALVYIHTSRHWSPNTLRGKRRVFSLAQRFRKTIYPFKIAHPREARVPSAFRRRIRCKYIFAFKETGRQRQNFENLDVSGEKRRRDVGHSLHGVRCAVLPHAVARRHGPALFRVRQVSVRRAPCDLNWIYLHLFHGPAKQERPLHVVRFEHVDNAP